MAVQYGLASRASPLVARSSRTASLRKAATAPATATVKRSGGEGFKRLEVLAFRTEGDSGSSGGRSSSLVVPDLTSLMARSPGASKLQLEYGGGEGGGGKGPRGRGRRRDGGGGGWWGKGGGDEDDEDKIRQMPKQVQMYVMDYSSLALKPIALGLFLVQSSTVMFVLLLSLVEQFDRRFRTVRPLAGMRG